MPSVRGAIVNSLKSSSYLYLSIFSRTFSMISIPAVCDTVLNRNSGCSLRRSMSARSRP
jgi:hypothetical protein